MKRILLTKNKYTLVDDEDFEYLNQWKWHFCEHHSGNDGYARRVEIINNKRISITMSRFIMNVSKEKQVDHKNLNKLDNRRSNLRICTQSENMANRKTKNKFLYKGISLIGKKWRASIKAYGKFYHLGMFDTKMQAAKIYNKAAKQYFGEFARLNKI